MKDEKIRRIVLSALLAALVCVATIVIQLPSPMNGYVNLGDCFVLISAWLLGPWYGAAASGIGSMFADVFTGYTHYAPGTLVIKGLMAMAAGLLFKMLKRKNSYLAMIFSGIASEAIMVAGYFLYAGLILGKGLFGDAGAALSIPGNCFQAIVGMVAGIAIMFVLKKTKTDEKLIGKK